MTENGPKIECMRRVRGQLFRGEQLYAKARGELPKDIVNLKFSRRIKTLVISNISDRFLNLTQVKSINLRITKFKGFLWSFNKA
jgi:hypothetical protein